MGRDDLTFLSFWSINDALEVEKACLQLDEMKRLGLNGAVFHPRNYPGNPEYLGTAYMERLSAIILHAKRIGMEFWLYDENGFPSGTASGRVLLENPHAKSVWVEYQGGKVVFQQRRTVSALDPDACAAFIRITFDGYKNGLSPEAFDYVTGFFSDEVSFHEDSAALKYGGVPWCDGIEERYQMEYGESLTDRLPLLFENGEGCEAVRSNYWELMARLLAERFYRPIAQWCERNHKRYTAHLKGEENPFFGISYHGSPYTALMEVSVPAIDALERYPGNHYYPHIASSLARQFGSGECACEAMGGCGWGVTPSDFVSYISWLVDCGINTFMFHLTQYTLNGQAIRDWPPSTPFHLSWKEAFPEALSRVRSYAEGLRGQETERILLVAPTRGIMEQFRPSETSSINEHNGDGTPDTPAGRITKDWLALVEQVWSTGALYDVAEERILEKHACVNGDGIRLGQVFYRRIILGRGCRFQDDRFARQLDAFVTKPSVNSTMDSCGTEAFTDMVIQQDDSPWDIQADDKNQILLPLVSTCLMEKSCEIALVQFDAAQDMYLTASDRVREIRVNGLSLRQENRPLRYRLPVGCMAKSQLHICVQLYEAGEQDPFVFLQGNFLVRSCTGFTEKADGRQLYTEGGFFLTTNHEGTRTDAMVETGYPFRNQPLHFEKEVAIPENATKFRLAHFDGAAVKLQIGDALPVWLFDSVEAILLPSGSAGKTALIRAELYPSTYNMYGPHHHMDGDRHLVSSDQYSGRKNFADDQNAPDNTLVRGFHFVKLGLNSSVIFMM